MSFTYCQVLPPSVLLSTPELANPAYTTFDETGPTASERIAGMNGGWVSAVSDQVEPAFVVLYTPPESFPTKTVEGLLGSTATDFALALSTCIHEAPPSLLLYTPSALTAYAKDGFDGLMSIRIAVGPTLLQN